MLNRIAALSFLFSSVCLAQAGPIDRGARESIDAGNQAWVDGMKSGNPSLIANTYADEALDCGADGQCALGRTAIAKKMEERLAKTGKARSASVTSLGAVQQGDFVYEWGHAEASFPNGAAIAGRYLTVWQRQTDGRWKIFRNMPIPNDRHE